MDKVYLEFTCNAIGSPPTHGCYPAVGHEPTKVGRKHTGTSNNGNGVAIAVSDGYVPKAGTNSVLIDLAKETVSYNGGAAKAIPKAAGPIYFMLSDGSSLASGNGEVNFGNNAFDKAVPAAAVAWNKAKPAPTPQTCTPQAAGKQCETLSSADLVFVGRNEAKQFNAGTPLSAALYAGKCVYWESTFTNHGDAARVYLPYQGVTSSTSTAAPRSSVFRDPGASFGGAAVTHRAVNHMQCAPGECASLVHALFALRKTSCLSPPHSN